MASFRCHLCSRQIIGHVRADEGDTCRIWHGREVVGLVWEIRDGEKRWAHIECKARGMKRIAKIT